MPSWPPKKDIRDPLSIPLQAVLVVLTVLLILGSISFFRHVLVVLQPKRWPPIDFHDKGRGGKLQGWEWVICVGVIPLLCFVARRGLAQASRNLLWQFQHQRRRFLMVVVLLLVVATIVWNVVLGPFLYPPLCRGWIWSDVGYIQGRAGWGHNMNMICKGRVWEPHVAQAITRYLYGQGRAIDVGAFIGYHTLRLAKHAAPHTVYALEGRLDRELSNNLRRNNAKNVKVIPETIDSNWKVPETILSDNATPLALIKIDCEGCELHFLRSAHDMILQWKPVIVLEIQDDATRQAARTHLGGQQMIPPEGSRDDVIRYLIDEFGYTVTPLTDVQDGSMTWDYLAVAEK